MFILFAIFLFLIPASFIVVCASIVWLLVQKRFKVALLVLGIYGVFIGLLVFSPGLLIAVPLVIGMILLRRKHTVAGVLVIGIWTVLVTSFVIYGGQHRRSDSGRALRWLKGEHGSEQHVDDLAEDARKAIDPAELQQWATSALQAYQLNNGNYTIPTNTIPASLRNLQSEDSTYEDISIDADKSLPPESRSVWVTWGGGFGHWGMAVGTPDFKAISDDANYFIQWKPGIYFWCQMR